jgi:hypothetical protein
MNTNALPVKPCAVITYTKQCILGSIGFKGMLAHVNIDFCQFLLNFLIEHEFSVFTFKM